VCEGTHAEQLAEDLKLAALDVDLEDGQAPALVAQLGHGRLEVCDELAKVCMDAVVLDLFGHLGIGRVTARLKGVYLAVRIPVCV
jgi:hypothetical protein